MAPQRQQPQQQFLLSSHSLTAACPAWKQRCWGPRSGVAPPSSSCYKWAHQATANALVIVLNPSLTLAVRLAALAAAQLITATAVRRGLSPSSASAMDAAVVAAADRPALPAFIFNFNTLESATPMLQVCTLFVNVHG